MRGRCYYIMLCYCDKCGGITDWGKPEEHECYCCGNFPLKPVPREYIDNFRWRDGDGESAFIEEVIKKSPNLDLYLYEHHDEIIKAKNAPLKAAREFQKNAVKCHYCGSTNVEKITLMSKAIHNSIFGIWSLGRNTKEFHCNNCGADF